MRVYKDFRGNWAADTVLTIPGDTPRRLVVETMKTSSGHVVTFARGLTLEGSSWVNASDKDFRVDLARNRPGRATQAFVADQHAIHTRDTATLMSRAIAFYRHGSEGRIHTRTLDNGMIVAVEPK